MGPKARESYYPLEQTKARAHSRSVPRGQNTIVGGLKQ
jgi:hypothetical protein